MKLKIWLPVLILLIFSGYLSISYMRIYQYIGSKRLPTPYIKNSFDIENTGKKGSIKYIALGDSLTAGVGNTTVENSYVYQVAKNLSKNYEKVSVINLGQPGATTKEVIKYQLESAISENPDYVTLFIGINDVHEKFTLTEYRSNLEKIISELKRNNETKIILVNLPYLGAGELLLPPYNYLLDFRTKQFNSVIEQVANENQITLVDLYSNTREVFKYSTNMYSEDLFHPSDKGYLLFGEIINANFGEQPRTSD